MSKQAKPIFTVGLPESCTQADLLAMRSTLFDKMSDYYVFVYISKQEDVKFETFYEKDFNEVKYEELKQIIISNLSNITNPYEEYKDMLETVGGRKYLEFKNKHGN